MIKPQKLLCTGKTMELTGYQREFLPGEALLPIEIQDLQVTASAEELESLASFFLDCAKKLKNQKVVNETLSLADSRPTPQTPVWIQVIKTD